jgi:hypothetical protein
MDIADPLTVQELAQPHTPPIQSNTSEQSFPVEQLEPAPKYISNILPTTILEEEGTYQHTGPPKHTTHSSAHQE